MDAGRDRFCALDRRDHRPAWADAGRGDRRCRALRAAGGGSCGGDYRLQRAGLCGVADFPGRGCGRDSACAGELRARSGDCCDQSRPGRSACDRRAARPQRPFCVARQRLGGGADGRVRLSAVEPVGVSCHLLSGDPDVAGACANPRAGDRRRAMPWRRSCARYRMPRPPACSISCASGRCWFSPAACCCFSWRTRRCCR